MSGGIQVNNVNQVIPNNLNPGGPMQATYMTPDCLLAYCSTRLRDLDTNMQKQFATQQAGIKDSQTLQDIEQQMKDIFDKDKDPKSGNLQSDCDPQDPSWANMRTQAESIQDPDAKAAALKAIDAASQMKSGTKFDDFKSSVLDGIDNGKQALSQGAELGMIGLQSLMSQRQTAIQMTTNLVQAFGESLKAVSGNVGK
jgi:hypothetical protein